MEAVTVPLSAVVINVPLILGRRIVRLAVALTLSSDVLKYPPLPSDAP